MFRFEISGDTGVPRQTTMEAAAAAWRDLVRLGHRSAGCRLMDGVSSALGAEIVAFRRGM